MATKVLGAFAFVSLVVLGTAACASNVEESEPEVDEAEADLTGARRVPLKYEGTCDFLRSCSRYSRNLPPGRVTWGCTGVGVCSDSALWVAGPNRSYCNKTVKICKGSQCTNALVKDVSVSRDWEASNGVLDALDLPHGLSGRCSGYGGGSVTVEVGGRVTPADRPDDGSPEPTSDDGCFSATLQRDMPELTCVQSRTTRLFYQCKAGKWYRGVEGSTGPYGVCASVVPLE